MEGVADRFTQPAVGVMDGIESDGLEFVRVNLPIGVQYRLVSADVDNFAYQTAALRIILDEADTPPPSAALR